MNARPPQSAQRGAALLEALIAILIFSLGILSVVAIQATSVRMAAEAQYRTKATLFANRLIGEMWTSGKTIAELQANFKSTDGPEYKKWVTDVEKFVDESGHPGNGLPGITGNDDLLPSVTITPLTRPSEITGEGSLAADIVITLYWRTPAMEPGEKRQHTVISQISRNP